MTLTVFGDVVCPFTYAGLVMLRAERDRRRPDLVLRLRAWPLEWINGRPLDPHHVAAEIAGLRPVVPDRFAGFDPATFPRTSLAALALVDVAYERDDALGERVAIAVREAVFEHGIDVGDPATLATLAAAHDLTVPDPDDTVRRVRADHELGQSLGVVGSPHFVTEHGSWFCPILHISQTDGVFTVRIDEPVRAEFLDAVLGPA